jgi:hypothetical protein
MSPKVEGQLKSVENITSQNNTPKRTDDLNVTVLKDTGKVISYEADNKQ